MMPSMRSSPVNQPRRKEAAQEKKRRKACLRALRSFRLCTLRSLLVLVALRARFKALPLVDCLLVAVVVGISVLVWRSAGNTGATPQRSHSTSESQ